MRKKTRAATSSGELSKLLELAARRPGVADVVSLHQRYQAKLAEINLKSGRRTRLSFTTSDSTA